MGFLEGKNALIDGVASNRSIAWGISQAMKREGANLAFTYQTEKMKSRVEKFAGQCDSDIDIPCDVSSDEQIEDVFSHRDDFWDHIHIIVPAVAFEPGAERAGHSLDCFTPEGLGLAYHIS